MRRSSEEPQMLLCSTCKEVKKLDCFSRVQRKQGKAVCCKQCVHEDKQAKASTRRSAEKPQMLIVQHVKKQRSLVAFQACGKITEKLLVS